MGLASGQEGRLQGIHFRTKLFLASGCRYGLVTTLSGSKVVSEFVEGTAESFRGSKVFKSQHRVVALFDAPMVLLDSIIFIAATPILHSLSQHFGDGPWIRVVPVRGHLFGTMSRDRLSTAEEALGHGHVPIGTQHRIDQLPFAVNRSIQITPPA